jgi:hypothetical protein
MSDNRKQIWVYVGIASVLFGIGLLFAIRNRRRVVRFSRSLVGMTEIAGNMGFTNEQFERLMKEVGWREGDAWCVFFVKLVWYNMAPEWLKAKIKRRVTGSTWTTWENLKDDPNFQISAVPKAGDMVIWRLYRDGEPTWDGHAGVVKSVGYGNFTTIEGNTNSLGGTEGFEVAEKTRTIDYTVKNGLRLIGFIRFA